MTSSETIRATGAAAIAGLVALGLASGLAFASPPEPVEPIPIEPVEPAVPAPTGFWLSLELIGPRGAQIDAAAAMRIPPIVDAVPRGGSPPPGEVVGRVDTLEQALAWIAEQAFDGGAVGFETDPTRTAPLPGGAMLRDHGVHLTALVLTGASDSGGTRQFEWTALLPGDLPIPSDWRPASLAVARAPVFAAPGSSVPPASERYRVVELADPIWQLGALDRCTDAGACLRWAQILVRQGDRWFGGWVLAAQIVRDDEWVLAPDGRRFALIASHRTRERVGYALIDQAPDGSRELPRGLTHPHSGAEWPATSLTMIADQLVALANGEPLL